MTVSGTEKGPHTLVSPPKPRLQGTPRTHHSDTLHHLTTQFLLLHHSIPRLQLGSKQKNMAREGLEGGGG
jgi:hypothetical protein